MDKAIQDPKVSVVIPSYNAALFLPKTLRSVLAQTFENLEVIVVDDGSTDDTEEAIQEFQKDKRLRYVKQTNGGAASARNHGVAIAKGELIAFLDSDDLWLPSKLEKQVPLFDDPNVGAAYCDREDIDEDDNKIPCNPWEFHKGEGLAGQLLVKNFVPMSSSIVRKSIAQLAGEFDTSLARSEDLDFWLRVALHTGFDYVTDQLVLHRRWANQLTQDKMKVWESSLTIQQRFLDAHPDAVSALQVRQGWAKRYTGRGRSFASRKKRMAALRDYLRALRYDIRHKPAIKEIVKLALFKS